VDVTADSDSPVELGETMQFTATATGTPDITYAWDFGDGVGTSTEQNPTYDYTEPGTYTVTVTATNPCGEDTDTLLVEVTCEDVEITELTSDSPVVLGETMNFTATATGTPDITYAWDFGGAGTQGGTDTNPTFLYDDPGTYTVTLTVENPCPSSDVETLIVVVCDPVEIVSLDSDSPVYVGEAMQFTSTVTGDAPITYAWDFGDEVGTSAEPNPTYTYAEAGTYTVTLTVENCVDMGGPFTDTEILVVEMKLYGIFLPFVARSY